MARVQADDEATRASPSSSTWAASSSPEARSARALTRRASGSAGVPAQDGLQGREGLVGEARARPLRRDDDPLEPGGRRRPGRGEQLEDEGPDLGGERVVLPERARGQERVVEGAARRAVLGRPAGAQEEGVRGRPLLDEPGDVGRRARRVAAGAAQAGAGQPDRGEAVARAERAVVERQGAPGVAGGEPVGLDRQGELGLAGAELRLRGRVRLVAPAGEEQGQAPQRA